MANLVTPGEYVDLIEVISEKGLGVWTTSNLASSVHCQKAAANATKILGQIKRSFSRISKDLFIFLYKTYIRHEASLGILCTDLVSVFSMGYGCFGKSTNACNQVSKRICGIAIQVEITKARKLLPILPSPTWRPN